MQVEFKFHCNLNPGTYFMNAGVVGLIEEGVPYLHRLIDACMFRVLPVMDNIATGPVSFKCEANYKELA